MLLQVTREEELAAATAATAEAKHQKEIMSGRRKMDAEIGKLQRKIAIAKGRLPMEVVDGDAQHQKGQDGEQC